MNYINNNNGPHNPSGNLGVGGSSFSSRGKGAHIKRLSVAPPIDENGVEDNPPPRTSRSHLLAGLRTAPKHNPQTVPASAPFDQSRFDDSSYRGAQDIPHSAMAQTFGAAGGYGQQQQRQQQYGGNGSMYTQNNQILSPPAWNALGSDAQMDPHKYEELMYLAAQQKHLEQQLATMKAMQEQFQGMNMNGQQPMPNSHMASLYNQQMMNGIQPMVQPVPSHPGLFVVFNPMTGQQTYAWDNNAQHQPHQPQPHYPLSPPSSGPSSSPEPEPAQNAAAAGWTRPSHPPRQSPSPPQDVEPLPKPSANAYRPGHRKSMSSVARNNFGGEGPKSAGPRSSAFPQTPQTGTFGPGMGRAGEHPVRQPKGPPPLDDLLAGPTALHEGSKNFATRQRRRAIFNLKRAGNDRRGGRADGHNGQTSPVSELAALSDADSEGLVGSNNSSKSNLNAIGTEHKLMRERSQDSNTFAGRVAHNRSPVDDEGADSPTGRKRMPMLVLTSAEKRKSYLPSGTS